MRSDASSIARIAYAMRDDSRDQLQSCFRIRPPNILGAGTSHLNRRPINPLVANGAKSDDMRGLRRSPSMRQCLLPATGKYVSQIGRHRTFSPRWEPRTTSQSLCLTGRVSAVMSIDVLTELQNFQPDETAVRSPIFSSRTSRIDVPLQHPEALIGCHPLNRPVSFAPVDSTLGRGLVTSRLHGHVRNYWDQAPAKSLRPSFSSSLKRRTDCFDQDFGQ